MFFAVTNELELTLDSDLVLMMCGLICFTAEELVFLEVLLETFCGTFFKCCLFETVLLPGLIQLGLFEILSETTEFFCVADPIYAAFFFLTVLTIFLLSESPFRSSAGFVGANSENWRSILSLLRSRSC